MRPDTHKIKRMIWNGGLLFLGCTIMALGYSLFLIPHHFVPGGISGLSIIINYFTRLPTYDVMGRGFRSMVAA